MIKLLYTIFIGLLLATVIGVGISAFYDSPKAPNFPEPTYSEKSAAVQSSPGIDASYQKTYDAYNKQYQIYNRNVSLISVSFALVILVISLTVLRSVVLIADGVLLGGIFALIYGIGRSFGSGEQKFMFLITALGLVVAVVLGFIKFVKPESQAKLSVKR